MGFGGLLAAGWAWQRYSDGRQNLTSVGIPGLPGWTRIDLAGVSSSGGTATDAALLGVGDDSTAAESLSEDRLLGVLYRRSNSTGVPVAVFSDFFCPYCRQLIARLAQRPQTEISVTWHELPLLGPASVQAARAAIAADMQGGYAEFQRVLFTAPFRPTAETFAKAATAAGLEPGQLLLDMNSNEVSRSLLLSRRAADTLGIYGTPGMVIGRTLIMGAVSDRSLDQLIADSKST